MVILTRAVSVYVISVLLLVACNEKPMESAASLAALSRPVLKLELKSSRVLVPQSAHVERGGVPGVFVLAEDKLARFRMVRTGKIVNDRVEILSGLSGSETLVVGDLRDVRDGSLIGTPGLGKAQQQFVPAGTASRSGQTQ
jgi:hypothetical protein